MTTDTRRTTADEHVRTALSETLRGYERELAEQASEHASAEPQYFMLNPDLCPPPPPISWWRRELAAFRFGWDHPIYSGADLVYTLVIGAALGVVIATWVTEGWLI